MFYKKLKNFFKKFTHLWKFLILIKNFLSNLSRLKDVIIMMILINIWPEQIYRFSTRKLLPGKKERISKKTMLSIPYELLKNKSSDIKTMEEINVIGRGSSFDLNDLRKINGPTFLVSFGAPLQIDNNDKIFYEHYLMISPGSKNYGRSYKAMAYEDLDKRFNFQTNKEFRQDNLTYVHTREKEIALFKKNGNKVLAFHGYRKNQDGNYYPLREYWESPSYLRMFDEKQCKRISQVEKIYKSPLWAPTGSFLPALCALSHFAKKINVYGWDNHLNSSPNKMKQWELLIKGYKFKYDTRSWNAQFEHLILNFYYGYQLSKLPNFNIYGYTGQLDKHNKLVNKIERALFN